MTQRMELFFKKWLKELIFFLKHDSYNWTSFYEPLFQYDSKNWTFLFLRFDFYSMTQRIQFLKKKKKKHLDAKNWTLLLEYDAKNWTLFECDSKNWTSFFLIWLKELNPFLNKTHRIDFLLKIWLTESNPSFQHDSKIELSFRNMSQRIEYDSKNCFFWKTWHSKTWTFSNLTQGLNIFSIWLKNWTLFLFQEIWLKEWNSFSKNDS